MGKHCSALCTNAWFLAESNTVFAPLSMYPSVPPLKSGGRETLASYALPKGTLSGRRFGGGMCSRRGHGSSEGSQSSQFMRSFARSKHISKQFENSAGAGVEPKGRRPSATAISSLDMEYSLFLVEVPCGYALCCYLT